MEEPTCTIGQGFSKEVTSLNIPKANIPKLSLAIPKRSLISSLYDYYHAFVHSRPQSSSEHDGQGGRALRNPGTSLSLISFSKKQSSVSDWSIQVLTKAGERVACLA